MVYWLREIKIDMIFLSIFSVLGLIIILLSLRLLNIESINNLKIFTSYLTLSFGIGFITIPLIVFVRFYLLKKEVDSNEML